MQNLRRLILFFAAIFAATSAHAGGLRITTWNLHWFPSGIANRRNLDHEQTRIAAAAEVIRKLDPDILVLQEVRDEVAAGALLNAVAQGAYHIAIVSRFREGGGIGWQQLVIAAKRPAAVAFAEPWKGANRVDPPRGFVYAEFDWDGRGISVYGVHLKSNLVRGGGERERQLNILKRELAADQLLTHTKDMALRIKGGAAIVIVAGDFNTTPDSAQFASEGTLSKFSRAGFDNPLLGLPASERATIRGGSGYSPATFDFVLVRGTAVEGVFRTESSVSDHMPVTLIVRQE